MQGICKSNKPPTYLDTTFSDIVVVSDFDLKFNRSLQPECFDTVRTDFQYELNVDACRQAITAIRSSACGFFPASACDLEWMLEFLVDSNVLDVIIAFFIRFIVTS